MLSTKIDRLYARRHFSADLPTGIAPTISSSSFRSQSQSQSHETKASPWDHRLSRESHKRQRATLKATASAIHESPPINLGVARPHAQYLPWTGLKLDSVPMDITGTEKSCITVPSDGYQGEYDFGTAMNYGYCAGSPQLLRFISEHVELIHGPAYQNWECCLTSGTTSALEIIFRMLCNSGESIIMESSTYPGAVEAIKPLGLRAVTIGMDSDGLLPNDLDLRLQQWDSTSGPKPSVLYTIPTGQNPTGVTSSLERRRMIYSIATRHDLVIIEDDPYYYLQLGRGAAASTTDEYVASLPPSYVSLDASGRVLRLDSTSKILAPGLRCGWLTGHAQLVTKFLHHSEFSTVSPSGPSQIMLHQLLEESWGHTGLLNWLSSLSMRYSQCRDVLLQACAKYLRADICKWNVPEAGMFLWITIDPSRNARRRASLRDVEDRLYNLACDGGVLISKGTWFAADPSEERTGLAFRMTFAAVTVELLDEGVRRFARAVAIEFPPL